MEKRESVWDVIKSIGYIAYICARTAHNLVSYPFSAEASEHRKKLGKDREEQWERYRNNCKTWKNYREMDKELRKRRFKRVTLDVFL